MWLLPKDSLSRKLHVALKIIKVGMDTRQVVARFEAERQALALMDHPNIAKVLDAGATETGRPYFVMELVRGIKLTEYCDQHKVGLTERLGLFIQICNAIQHAHQKGIIHRDIKPSNILVTMHDGLPVPKVIDFGIAKATEHRLTEKTLFTAYEQFMGTPAYMSPEQAEMTGLDIDTRSDIYSLGVLLYELLTGRTPFDARELLKRGLDEVRRTIREVEPPRPSTRLSTLADAELSTVAQARSAEAPKLANIVRGDLDWIVMKCLEKDRTRRYETANGVGMDIKRYLSQEPIAARPPSQIYRFHKLIRRNKLAFAAAAAVLVALIGGLGFSTLSFIRERAARAEATARRVEAEQARVGEQEQRERAEESAAKARATATTLEIERAELLFERNSAGEALAYLSRLLRQQPTNRVVAERIVSALSHRNFCLPLAALRHEAPVTFAQFSRDGTQVVTAAGDGTARVWNGHTGRPVTQPLRHGAEVLCAQFSSNAQWVVTASSDRTARIWDVRTSQEVCESLKHSGEVTFAGFSSDGELVLTTAQDKTARVWNARSGKMILELPHEEDVWHGQFSPDGRWVLTASRDPLKPAISGRAHLWEWPTAKLLRAFPNRAGFVPRFNPTGDRLINNGVGVWNLASIPFVLEWQIPNPDAYIQVAEFSPDGLRVATGSQHNIARVWDLHDREAITPQLHHENHAVAVPFSPDGDKLASGGLDNAVRIWDAKTGKLLSETLPHDSGVRSVEFAADGQRLLTTCRGGATAWVWDIRVGQPVSVTFNHGSRNVSTARFSPDGRRIVTSGWTRRARVWDASTGEPITPWLTHRFDLWDAQCSKDGARVITGDEDGIAQIWDAQTGRRLTGPLRHERGAFVRSAQFSPDGRRVVTAGSNDKTARIWDAETGNKLATLRHEASVSAAKFSPDGNTIVTASGDKTARVWDANTGRLLFQLSHADAVSGAQFSPTGDRILTGSRDKTACVWDARTGQRLLGPLQHNDEVSATFSPDGRKIGTAAGTVVQIWDAFTGEPVCQPLKHNNRVGVSFSPDGARVVTRSQDGIARIWDVLSGHPLSEALNHGAAVTRAEFSPDGQWVVTGALNGTVRLWPAHRLHLPIPPWLAELAEAVAGQRLNERGMTETVPTEKLFQLKERLVQTPADAPNSKWIKWLLAPTAARQISPEAPMTVHEYAERLEKTVLIEADAHAADIPQNTYLTSGERTALTEAGAATGSFGMADPLANLQRAALLAPTNAPVQAKLSLFSLGTNVVPDRRQLTHADWRSRRALTQAPDDATVWWVRAQLCDRLGDLAAALEAADRASRSNPADAAFWYQKGLLLEKTNRLAQALDAYTQSLSLCGRHTKSYLLPGMAFLRRAQLFKEQGRMADAATDNLAAFGLPPRDGGTPENLLDLSGYYNATPKENWSAASADKGGPGRNLTALPLGRTNFAGVEFDVRGIVQLSGVSPQQWYAHYPAKVEEIKVDQSCHYLHFLHATRGPAADGTKIGSYEVHYADGQKASIPIRYGPDVRHWERDDKTDRDTGAVVVWSGTNAVGAAVRLFKSTWQNPRPDVAIHTIDFVSALTPAAPFLLAITAEPLKP